LELRQATGDTDVSYYLADNVTTVGSLTIYPSIADRRVTLYVGNHNLTVGTNLQLGNTAGSLYTGSIDFGSGTSSVSGDIKRFSTSSGNTINLNSASVSVGGNIDFTGITVTPGTSTVTMTATDAGNTVTSASQSFNNLTFNGSGGSWTPADNLTVSGILNINAGTFDASNKTITLSGSGTPLVVGGTFTASTSTIVYSGGDSTTQTIPGGLTFYNLTATTASNSAGRTINFTGSSTTNDSGTLYLSGANSKILTV
jgi:hypothetical protein